MYEARYSIVAIPNIGDTLNGKKTKTHISCRTFLKSLLIATNSLRWEGLYWNIWG